ncbi:MAG: tyrosine-type recombinase/integrase [Owenweeksia sp.]
MTTAKNLLSAEEGSTETKRVILFTDVAIRNLKPEDKRVTWWAQGMPGFGIRVTPKGRKTFIYYYYHADQKRYRTKTYGIYPKYSLARAQSLYTRDKELVQIGEDPAADQVEKNKALQELPTVNELIDEWEQYGMARGTKSIKNQTAYVRRDFGRMFGYSKINKITKQHIRAVNKEILARGSPGAALASWQNIKCMFNLAKDWYDIDKNPAAALKPPAPKRSRDRVLSPKEIYSFWHGLKDTCMNSVIKAALMMMLVTLQRGHEVRHMEWARIDEKEKVWEFPKEVAKNNIFHRVPLNVYALKIIEDMKGYTSGTPYVFAISPYHKSKITPDRDDLKVMRYETLSENTRGNCEKWNCEHFTPHDLRRTASTILTGVGVPRFFIKKMLNHVDNDGATSVYDRYAYDYEKQKTADIWAFVLDQILHVESVEDVPAMAELRERVRKRGIL